MQLVRSVIASRVIHRFRMAKLCSLGEGFIQGIEVAWPELNEVAVDDVHEEVDRCVVVV